MKEKKEKKNSLQLEKKRQEENKQKKEKKKERKKLNRIRKIVQESNIDARDKKGVKREGKNHEKGEGRAKRETDGIG